MKEEKIKTITELYNQMYEANKKRIEKYKKADYKLTSTHEITKEFNRDIEDQTATNSIIKRKSSKI